MNQRVSDVLTALEVLAVDGVIKVSIGPGGDYRLDVIDEALEALDMLSTTMQIIETVITDPDVQTSLVNSDSKQFAMYRFVSERYDQALLYVRPHGARGYDQYFEYGNASGVEASISFIANPTNPHRLIRKKDPDGVSIRFDREGRSTNESPFSPYRDPTRDQGSISLDLSSILGRHDTAAVRIGSLVAAGNSLRASHQGIDADLHHNNNYFDQRRYGSREGFSKLAVYVVHLAEAQIALQQHGRHRSAYGRLATSIAGGAVAAGASLRQ
jgi:hypothetical protein